MVLVQGRYGVEQPALVRHSLGGGHEAPVGVAVLVKDLLVELLDENGTNRWPRTRARSQVPIPRTINLSFPNRHHHFFGQPDGNNLFLWT